MEEILFCKGGADAESKTATDLSIVVKMVLQQRGA